MPSPRRPSASIWPSAATTSKSAPTPSPGRPFLAARAKLSHAVIVTDENVQEPHAVRVAESLAGRKIHVAIVAVKPGEQSKSLDVAAGLWQGLLELNADRQTVVVAVGGGVVGDLAGFIAATYARGLRFLQVPTTLLAQVDSSVGGKVGINLPERQEHGRGIPAAAGRADRHRHARHPAAARISLRAWARSSSTACSSTPSCLTTSKPMRPSWSSATPEVLVHVIARCCRLKAEVVRRDEREESGHRAVLNYGHSFAHALETLAGYGTLLHGEAVAIGMNCAARLAEQLGRVDAALVERQRKLLRSSICRCNCPS